MRWLVLTVLGLMALAGMSLAGPWAFDETLARYPSVHRLLGWRPPEEVARAEAIEGVHHVARQVGREIQQALGKMPPEQVAAQLQTLLYGPLPSQRVLTASAEGGAVTADVDLHDSHPYRRPGERERRYTVRLCARITVTDKAEVESLECPQTSSWPAEPADETL